MITSFRHDKQKISERRRLLGYTLAFALLLLLFRTPIADVLSSFFFGVFRPVTMLESSIEEWWKDKVAYVASKESLARENRRLSEALELVAIEAYSREALRKENTALKALLGRSGERTFLLARVLATPGRSAYDTLLIDVGVNDGVQVGMKVFVDGDFVVGEVSKVMEKGALVTLYSSYGHEFPVTVGTSSSPGIAKGEGGGNFRIALPRGIPIVPGDLAEIPALAPEYAGVVAAVYQQEGSSLQDVYVGWPFNMNELTWVYVAVDLLTEPSQSNEHE